MTLLAIDVGTTGVTALLVSTDASIVAKGYQEFPQHFPQEGWVEHDPAEIWDATLAACERALAGDEVPSAIGITNQRETLVLWDRETLGSPMKAIVWQDRRTAGICAQLKADGHEAMVAERTGLRLDPYFTGTKITWVHDNAPHVFAGIKAGRTAIGTVDSYLIARLTRGLHHITDASNASRTLLYNLTTGDWDDDLCDLFEVPREALPEIVPSYGEVATTDPDCFFGLSVPIAGIAGDQQAALFGQACFVPGSSKCTYGTGSFVLVNTGEELVRSENGLLTTVAWQHPDGTREFALEGAVFVTGSAIQWLRDGLGIIRNAAESEDLALSVPDSGGVVFVPALAGLGAPDWDPHARGTILGITRGTTRAHLVRATLEAIAYQVRDVVDVMVHESGVKLPRLAVDGGASANNFLCQTQANQLQVPVVRPAVLETTGLGAAFLAGLGTGVWTSQEELARTWREDAKFSPGAMDAKGHRRWRTAVERSRGWASMD
ncbi:MAG: glycerol kinase GlpK [Actinobacteria bacterium]|nr:glycerol kinase GlpK [Actinomycetota bacterium]MCB9412270.1 glycerol kinase GlpK [Actinomycetota bacterium]